MELSVKSKGKKEESRKHFTFNNLVLYRDISFGLEIGAGAEEFCSFVLSFESICDLKYL